MAALSGFSFICESLAGCLLVASMTSGFAIINKLDLPRAKVSLKLHSTLPDLQEFKPVECLVLYLMSYPALAMYRFIPQGHAFGFLFLALGLLSVLLWGIGPAVIKMKKEDETKDEFGSLTEEVIFKKEKTHFRGESNMSSNFTVDTTSVVDLQEEENVITPTATNKGEKSGDDYERDMEHKEENKDRFSSSETNLYHTPLSEEALASLDRDLCDSCKLRLEESDLRIGVIVPSSVPRSSVKLTEDEDALSVVTWNPKPEVLKPSTSNEDLTGHRRGSSHQPDKPRRLETHRKCKSQLPISVNLIDDSNQEPHYSNLIDSANAPIFGVDSEGRVNVWNKCAMRIVGYTAEEVMGKNLVKQFITKDYQASVGTVIDRALLGDETANFEASLSIILLY